MNCAFYLNQIVLKSKNKTILEQIQERKAKLRKSKSVPTFGTIPLRTYSSCRRLTGVLPTQPPLPSPSDVYSKNTTKCRQSINQTDRNLILPSSSSSCLLLALDLASRILIYNQCTTSTLLWIKVWIVQLSRVTLEEHSKIGSNYFMIKLEKRVSKLAFLRKKTENLATISKIRFRVENFLLSVDN